MTLLTFLFTGVLASAQTNDAKLNDLDARLKTLEQSQKANTQSLTDEIARLKTANSVPELTGASFMGLGAAASRVYFSKNPLSIGGYGEMTYTDPRGGATGNRSDVYRFVPYFSYRFSDKIIFNAEVEFEHSDEVAVEFAYLDFIAAPGLGVRAGHVLVPIGQINLRHEPNYFHTVSRPDVERLIIPSTWHENGVLFFGQFSQWRYHLGVVNGLKARSAATNAGDNTSWVRNWRQGGSEAETEDLAWVARGDWAPNSNMEIGVSYYNGDSGQMAEGTLGKNNVQIAAVHGRWAAYAWEVDGLFVQGRLSDRDGLGVPAGGYVPADMVEGYYVTLANNLLWGRGGDEALKIFARYSDYNLQKEVPDNATVNESLDRQIWSFGVNYFPDPQVVIKANYDLKDSAAGDLDDAFELGLGLVF